MVFIHYLKDTKAKGLEKQSFGAFVIIDGSLDLILSDEKMITHNTIC